jgi:hypothetical protein
LYARTFRIIGYDDCHSVNFHNPVCRMHFRCRWDIREEQMGDKYS